MESGSGPSREEPVATADQVRALRRWLIVAGVWAVAASAIGLIALLEVRDDERSENLASQVDRLSDRLSERLDRLDERLDSLPTSDDLSKLERRLEDAEGDVSRAGDRIDDLDGQLSDLETTVDDLEQRVDEQQDTTPEP